jgi:alginate O-acetyltransferase complex protein AlgI
MFSAKWDPLPAALRQGTTFLLVVIGWVFFRATDFTMAWTLLGKMFVPVTGAVFDGLPVFATAGLLAAAWAMFGPNAFDVDRQRTFKPSHAYAAAAVFGCCLALMAGGGASPFLYFQF